MATITYFTDNVQPVDVVNNVKQVATALLDFTKQAVTAGDVVQALVIPAGALVTKVATIVRTAAGAACTATVGDGDGAASWDASIDLNQAADTATYSAAGTDAYAQGKYYKDEDTIDLVMGHDNAVAKLLVIAEYSIIEGL